MGKTGKTLSVFLVLLVLFFITLFFYQRKNNVPMKSYLPADKQERQAEISVENSSKSVATGKADDVFKDLSASLEDEKKIDDEEIAETKASLDDSAEVSAFGQTYDEKEF